MMPKTLFAPSPALRLPPELLREIFALLSVHSRKSCTLVCRSWTDMSSPLLFREVHVRGTRYNGEYELREPLAYLERDRIRPYVRELHISDGLLTLSSLRRVLASLSHLRVLRLCQRLSFQADLHSSEREAWTLRSLSTLELFLPASGNDELYECLPHLLDEIGHFGITVPISAPPAGGATKTPTTSRTVRVRSLTVSHTGALRFWKQAFATLHSIIDPTHLTSFTEVSPTGLDQLHVHALAPFRNLQHLSTKILLDDVHKFLTLSAFPNLTSLHLAAHVFLYFVAPGFDESNSNGAWSAVAATLDRATPTLQHLHIELSFSNVYLVPMSPALRSRSLNLNLQDEFYPRLQSFNWELIGKSVAVRRPVSLRSVKIGVLLDGINCKGEDEGDVPFALVERGLQDRIPEWCTQDTEMQKLIDVSLRW